MSSRKRAWLLVGVALVIVLALATSVRLQQRKAVQSKEAAKLKTSSGERVTVEAAPVKLGEVVAATEVTGLLQPEADVSLVSEIPGKVQKVLVDVGQQVKAGEVLMELDREELTAQARQAEAGVTTARAGTQQAEANLKSARDNLARMKELYAKRAATKQQLEMAQTQADVARAQVESARAAVVQVEAAQKMARTQLANATIKAPMEGVVSFRNIDPGEMASPGVPLVGIVSARQVYVELSLTEELVGKVQDGLPVQVRLEAFTGRSFAGRLTNLAPAADPRTRAFAARVRLDNQAGELRPGMFATVSLATERRSGVIAIPTVAVVDRNGQPVVFVVEGGRAVERPVTIGLRNSQVSEVRSGLNPGEQVVVRGQLQLTDGVAVRLAGKGAGK